MVGYDDLSRHGGAATTLLKGISLATVPKILGPDRPQTTAFADPANSTRTRAGVRRARRQRLRWMSQNWLGHLTAVGAVTATGSRLNLAHDRPGREFFALVRSGQLTR
jgi:hypothetical protein